jgi:PIN domain
VIASVHGPRCIAAEAVASEIIQRIPRLAEQRKLDATTLFAALKVMPIEWKPPTAYADRFKEASERMAARDPDDSQRARNPRYAQLCCAT